ncbi:MAG: hypothetical protein H0W16_04910 [Actinobacteria bacterium]|nr:hypothetical protein [Actinomycetota bacterium]
MLGRLVVSTAFAWLILCAPFASAGSSDACAQRVIRDWYSGGRVDGLYPLGCYRAAIRALPNDVLEYSDADKDIARALAFARRARDDDAAREQPGAKPLAPEPPVATTDSPATKAAPLTAPTPSHPLEKPTAKPVAKPSERLKDAPTRVAAGPEAVEVSAAVPYPVIVLAALAATLLATGAIGWLLARRR